MPGDAQLGGHRAKLSGFNISPSIRVYCLDAYQNVMDDADTVKATWNSLSYSCHCSNYFNIKSLNN